LAKEPRKESIHWFDPKDADANDVEVLMLAVLAVYSAPSAGTIQKWAADINLERMAAYTLKHEWKPAESWGHTNKVSNLFQPLEHAVKRKWSGEELAAVGTAMRAATFHRGQHDALDEGRLRHWLSTPPRGVGASKKRPGLPRWRTWRMVDVGECIKRHGIEIRKLLKLDVEMEDVPRACDVPSGRVENRDFGCRLY
jgi:hypothetical protein